MKSLCIAIGGICIMLLPQLANAQAVDDPFSDYLQRSQSISLGAGNDNEANEAIQTITPWPPYSWDRAIPGDGRYAVDSMERMYRVPEPFDQRGGSAGGAGGASGPQGSSPTGQSVTPMQPLSSE